MIGKILGNRYEIEEIIGSGGMAIVYRATDRLLNREVAIKMLRAELKDDKEFVERFRVEAQSAASLNHSNIVSVHDVGNENGIDYFVMEYIEGKTLKERIGEGPIGWKTACNYVIQICDAIEHAHRKNIVHRDIKPHNMMLTKDDVIKVTDFGIARAVTSSTIVRQGNVIGSVHYFSPEQACGGVVDFKSDIYSIGILLYELLVGKVPFDADNSVAIAKMHVDMAPTPPSEINPTIPQSLSDIVLKAMAKQSAKRYANAAEFAEDLRKVVISPASVDLSDSEETKFIPVLSESELDKIEKETEKKPVKKSEKKNNTPVWITVGVIAAICLVAVIYFISASGKTVDVPELVGKDYEDVMEEYSDAIFKITKEAETNSDEEAAGVIISQDPEEGQIGKNQIISVIISKGRGSISLPNFVGKNVEEVEKMLENKKLTNVSFEYENHETYEKDMVYKQKPGRGSMVKEDDKITIYVSNGSDGIKVKVPNITGYTKEIAEATLEAVGLKLGEIREKHSSKPKGEVIEQVILDGTEVKSGTSIAITVSLGEAETPKPTPKPTATPKPVSTSKPDDEIDSTSEPVTAAEVG